MPVDLATLLTDARYWPRHQVAAITPIRLAFNGLGGTTGALPATSDTGVGNAWDSVSQGTGCVLQYDNTHGGNQGCQSIQFGTPATAATDFVRWTQQHLSQPQAWYSVYANLSAYGGTSFSFISPRRDGDLGAAGTVRITPAGLITLNDAAGVVQATSQTTVPLNQDFRLEARVVASNGVGGSLEMRVYYTANSAVPDEVLSVGGIQTSTGGQNVAGVRFGVGNNVIANVGPGWMWGMQMSNVGYPPPLFPSVGISDSGSGLDSIADSVAITLTDPGNSTDGVVIGVAAGLADSASGSDTFGDAAAVALADPGASLDAIVAAITASLPDSGIGTDILVAVQPKALADAGSGADAIAVAVAAALGDIGEGVDAVVQYFHFGDTGQGSDSPVISVILSLGDVGAGTDSLQASQVFLVNLSDAGVGTDTLVAVSDAPQSITLADSGSGADSMSVAPAIALSDFGVGSDTVVIVVSMWLGFDRPVEEGHASFDPGKFHAEEALPAMPFKPSVTGGRDSVIVVRQSWDMTEAMFLAHMQHMHNGRSVSEHRNAHIGGLGGEPRHFHG